MTGRDQAGRANGSGRDGDRSAKRGGLERTRLDLLASKRLWNEYVIKIATYEYQLSVYLSADIVANYLERLARNRHLCGHQ